MMVMEQISRPKIEGGCFKSKGELGTPLQSPDCGRLPVVRPVAEYRTRG